jgi:predicted SAM-dependent methyltransferase
MKIPWWCKIVIKIFLSRFPLGYFFWQRLGIFRHGQMDNSEYAIRIFNSHIERAGLSTDLNFKTVLELGPGDSIATAIIASAYGARAILVDTGKFICDDINPYLELVRVLEKQNLSPPDLSRCLTINDILDQCCAQFMTEGLTSLMQIESNSIDLLFSQAVLEHVKKSYFKETMQECHRILRSDGICSHQIDLRDHLDNALNNLRISERLWESNFFSKSGFYTNRIRYSQMMDLFDDAGFTMEITGLKHWEELPTSRNKFIKEFRDFPIEELCISVFDVVLKKKSHLV